VCTCCTLQEDYRGVASALTRMGATHTEVNLDRFAADLRDVARRVNALQPEITLGSDTYGMNILWWCRPDGMCTSSL
jgi:predicted unusual protein kinase regulating ubiquinone biosynthesis (AarF/ABC1/UbiB family)